MVSTPANRVAEREGPSIPGEEDWMAVVRMGPQAVLVETMPNVEGWGGGGWGVAFGGVDALGVRSWRAVAMLASKMPMMGFWVEDLRAGRRECGE